MPETHNICLKPVTCHAWNKNATQLALSPNNHEVEIFGLVAGSWKRQAVLSEHVQLVKGIDWAANSNKIVTCAADRNAYVWTHEGGNKWKPILVILRNSRAATCVKWSPMENKFAVGSGARLISVCYFEQENDWWVSKHIKKPLRSTVNSLDWHPNNVLLACASNDSKARVFSAYVKEVDAKPASTCWGKKMTFANLMAEYVCGGWVHGVSFNQSGDLLAWVSHDSSVSVANPANPEPVMTVQTQYLPLLTVIWTSASTIIAAGHDCTPMQFNIDGRGALTFAGKVDQQKKSGPAKISAKQHFQSLDYCAQSQDTSEKKLSTVHQSTITDLKIHTGDKSNCARFSSIGIDGMLAIWETKSLEVSMGGLKI